MWIELAKRFVPFTVALTLGLLVASFFVSLKPSTRFRIEPRYEYNQKYYNKSCWSHNKRFDRDFEQRNQASDFGFQEGEIDFNSITPVAPAAPTVPRERR